MPRGDKSKYSDKQKRQAEHIEESYEEKGTPEREAQRRAWATVNKTTGGARRSSPGAARKSKSKSKNKSSRAATEQSTAARSAAARKAIHARRARGGSGHRGK